MKLEAPPVYLDIEFLFQPDQAGPLRDVAERSDEIGIETQNHGLVAHYYLYLHFTRLFVRACATVKYPFSL